jgi:tryptophan-rich sensory protein
MKTLKLFISIIICQLAGIIGAFFTTPNIDTWYQTIVRPDWTPASWVFAPVWITLYTLMGIALFFVWEKKGSVNIKKAVSVFGFQLVLNSLWSIIFFGFNNITLALAEIVFLLGAIVWTMVEFRKISRTAFYLLIPYLLWVCLATALNFNIWILN